MEETHSFASLLLVVGLAFIVPLLLLRFRGLMIPAVVGEIFAGIIIGRSVLDIVPQDDLVLDLLAELGFVFLMFIAGMEIDFTGMRLTYAGQSPEGSLRWGPLYLGGLHFAMTLALATLFGLILLGAGLVDDVWMMALILSTTSLGVVMPVLKEKGLAAGAYGQTIMTSAMIADFATMLLITVLVAMMSSSANLKILLIGVLFVLVFAVYQFGMLFFSEIPGLRRAMAELSHASTQIKVRAAFTIMLVFVVLSEALGTELVLGAFLAGAVMSLLMTPEDTPLRQKLEAFGFGFFIPIFFIMVGVRFDLQSLLYSASAMLLVPLLLVAAVLVKLVPSLVFKLRFTNRESIAAGVLLTARLSLIIAASAIGLRLGIISESVNAAIILVAAVTVTAAPVAFSRVAPEPKELAPHIVIASTGELGLQVAERMLDHGEKVVLIDADEADVQRARKRGIEAVRARLDQDEPPVAPYLENASAVVCTSSDKAFNYRVCQVARTAYGIRHIVVQVNDRQDRALFEKMGVRTLNPALDRVSLFALLGRSPDLYELLTRTDEEQEVADVMVRQTRMTKLPLKKLGLPRDMLVLAIRRRNELIVPQGDTKLDLGDKLTLVGSAESVRRARELFTSAWR